MSHIINKLTQLRFLTNKSHTIKELDIDILSERISITVQSNKIMASYDNGVWGFGHSTTHYIDDSIEYYTFGFKAIDKSIEFVKEVIMNELDNSYTKSNDIADLDITSKEARIRIGSALKIISKRLKSGMEE
jgi:hypothetical protein